MSNLIKRSITGIIFIAVLAGATWFNEWTFLCLFLIVLTASLIEFYRLAHFERVSPQWVLGITLGILVYILSWLYFTTEIEPIAFLLVVPIGVFIFIIELFRNKRKPFSNIAYTLLGVLYIAVPISLFNSFVFNSDFSHTYSPYLLLGIFLLLWTFDTGAYLIGITFGRNRLFERISPKKSWEGFFGGAAFTLGMAYYLSTLFSEITMIDWLVVGAFIIVFGTLGDLVESMFKRSIGAKDSGSILPGHGGMLDRFDGIFLATPMIFVYLQFFG